jgi:uncharacterized protein (DUF433 family)
MPPLPPVRLHHPHVVCDPAVLGGSPIIAGSRVPVRRLWAWHRGGTSIETLLRRYPQLGPARVLDALAFAYDNQELVDEDLSRERALLEQQATPPPPGLRPLAQQPLPLDGLAAKEGRGPSRSGPSRRKT